MKKQMSAEDYRNDEAFSRSQLFKLSKSPAHFKYALENPEVETPALAFGTAFHAYVLEKDKFDSEYIVAPKLDRRTKEGKALAAQIEASGKIPISEDAFAQIQVMAESVMSNKYAAALLNGGEHEKSYFWTDKLTGLKLKCRPDCRTDLRSTSVIVDLKPQKMPIQTALCTVVLNMVMTCRRRCTRRVCQRWKANSIDLFLSLLKNHRLMPATSLKLTILSYRKVQKTLTTIFTLSKSVLKQVTGTATTAKTAI